MLLLVRLIHRSPYDGNWGENSLRVEAVRLHMGLPADHVVEVEFYRGNTMRDFLSYARLFKANVIEVPPTAVDEVIKTPQSAQDQTKRLMAELTTDCPWYEGWRGPIIQLAESGSYQLLNYTFTESISKLPIV